MQETERSRESRVQIAMQAVTGYIRSNRLRVGDIFPGEAYFAERAGVSRAVMREAFGALAALHLIDVGNGRKPRVGAIDGSIIATSLEHAIMTEQITVPDIWDVRRTIEVRTAALAAARRTGLQAERILRHAEAMIEDQDDFEQMTAHDIALHEDIAQASGNALFIQIVSSFGPLMKVAVPAAWRTRTTAQQRKAILDQHLEVARSIHDGDAERAAAAMNGHFDESVGHILGRIAPETSEQH